MMTISLVNSYGVPLVTPHMITVDLATEAVGSIVKDGFYHNGDCTNNINDSSPLVMNTGTFGQNFILSPPRSIIILRFIINPIVTSPMTAAIPFNLSRSVISPVATIST